MKKIAMLATVLAMVVGQIYTVQAISLTPENEAAKPKMIAGSITKETKVSDTASDIEVQTAKDSDGNQETVILHVTPSTYVADSKTGAATTIADRKGNAIVAYYGPVETRSMPPQSNALAVIVNVSEDDSQPPKFSAVEEINEIEGGGIKVLTEGGSVWVTINKDADISPFRTRNIATLDDIQEGTDLLLWYNQVAMSFPAQATATKVVILGRNSTADQAAATEAPSATEAPAETAVPYATTPQAITFTLPVDETYTENKVILVPLRAVAEGLGYVVGWNESEQKVTVASGTDIHLLNIGSVTYDDTKLSTAPVIKNDRTFVPVEYFEKILGALYSLKDDTIVFTLSKTE
ncbi:MAG: copper amine oxidase N-terminal domain-containing protein [Clostridiales bacterium]|jgi:hypothetical protein|nr:copper amine oxidase N-terminal domain-containing protein [Clostridiales bacterium]